MYRAADMHTALEYNRESGSALFRPKIRPNILEIICQIQIFCFWSQLAVLGENQIFCFRQMFGIMPKTDCSAWVLGRIFKIWPKTEKSAKTGYLAFWVPNFGFSRNKTVLSVVLYTALIKFRPRDTIHCRPRSSRPRCHRRRRLRRRDAPSSLGSRAQMCLRRRRKGNEKETPVMGKLLSFSSSYFWARNFGTIVTSVLQLPLL